MTTKTFEVRDRGTFIPVLAIRLAPVDERDQWLLARAGFGSTPQRQSTYVVLVNLVKTHEATYDEYGWNTNTRTMRIAHQHIIQHFDELENGAVVCVEHILGERVEPKRTEQEIQR